MEPIIPFTPPMPEPEKQEVRESAPVHTGLHTYAGDMAQTLRDQKGSLIKIAIAEQHKREADEQDLSAATPKNRFFMIAGILLVALAIIAVIFVFISKSGTVAPEQSNVAPSLIFADSQKEINTTDLTLDKVFLSATSEVQSQTIKLNTIEQAYFTAETPAGKQILGTPDFFKLIRASTSPRLLRSLGSTFMFGVHAYDGNQAFILFTTNSREDTLSGMLAWEDKLFDDTYQLFGIDITDKGYLFSKKFEDAIVQNKDARVIRDANGKIVLMYLFPTDNTLIITNGQNALQEVFTRIQDLKVAR